MNDDSRDKRVLIADDDGVALVLLETLLRKWDYEVVITEDGIQALDRLQSGVGPSLAVLDWMMPGLDGPEVCQRLRAGSANRPIYLILLTTLDAKEKIVQGLEAGADDYLVKPFHADELRARVRVGERMVGLEIELTKRVRELEAALANVKQLQGLLPICSYCKKIRDDQDYWHQVERYVGQHANVQFSHSICPTCYEEVIVPQLDAVDEKQRGD